MNTPFNRHYAAKIISVREIYKSVAEVSIELESPLIYDPGQYVWLELLTPGDDSTRRAFSIFRQTDEKQISIIAALTPGVFQTALEKALDGEQATIIGPFGSSFSCKKLSQQGTVMIASGTGLVPFLAVLQEQVNRTTTMPCLVVCVSSPLSPKPLEKMLEVLSLQHSWLTIAKVTSDFTLQELEPHMQKLGLDNSANWWVAGDQLLSDHISLLLQTNVSSDHVVFERFYPRAFEYLTLEKVQASIADGSILTQAIQNSTNHTIITDGNGLILFANKAAENITGYSQKEMIGNTPRLWGGMMNPEFYVQFWHRKKSGEAFSGEFVNRRKNGELYYSIAHISPLFDEARRVIGFIGTEEDITELKTKQQALEVLNTRFLLATQSANIGVWEWDLETDNLVWDEQMYLLYGYSPSILKDAPSTQELRRQRIVPEDFLTLEEKRLQAIKNGSDLDTLFRIQISSSETKFIKTHATVRYDKEGKPITMIGVNWDVTAERVVDQAKTEFVSLASHQLRTPLTSINWYTEMLLSGDAGAINEKQKKFLTEVYSSSKRMVDLVSALLNVSRIELGNFALDPVLVSPVSLVQDVLKDLHLMIVQKHLSVTETHDEISKLMLDPKLMRIIYENLLTNAIKYTPEHGSIHVIHRVSPTNPMMLEIEVGDTGVGIPTSEQGKIFNKLFRGTNVQEIDTQGTGLGLYIVKAIVAQSGGTISFTSKENNGTVFIVQIPLMGMIKKPGSKALESGKRHTDDV